MVWKLIASIVISIALLIYLVPVPKSCFGAVCTMHVILHEDRLPSFPSGVDKVDSNTTVFLSTSRPMSTSSMTEHLPTTFSVSAPAQSAKQDIVTTFEAFVPIFGSTGNFGSDSTRLKLIEISLASTINLEVTVTIVTHTSFPDLDRLKEIMSKFDHVRLAVYSDDVVHYKSSNWVQLVESFKIAHLLENRFKNLLYIELDMTLSCIQLYRA